MRIESRWLALVLTTSTAVGCVSSSAGLDAAHETVRSRIGASAASDGELASLRKELLSKPMTADLAARIALAESPRANHALAMIGLSRAELTRALRLPNPRAHFGASFEGDDEVDLELDVTLDLLAFVLLPGREHAAALRLDAAALDAAAELLRVAFDARRAFIDYQASKQVFEIEKTTLFVAAQASEFATRLQDAGNTPRLPMLTERARYEEARLALARAEADTAAARGRLNASMGLFSEDAASWDTTEELASPAAFDFGTLQAKAVRASLEIDAAVKRYGAADASADVAWGQAFVPSLGAGVGAHLEDDQWGVGPVVELSLPLFHQAQGELEAAHAEREVAQSAHRGAALRTRSSARAVASRLRAADDAVRFYDTTLLPLRAEIVEETLKQYNAMDASTFDVLLAKRETLMASRARTLALRDYWLARTDADALLAGVSPAMDAPAAGASPGASPSTAAPAAH